MARRKGGIGSGGHDELRDAFPLLVGLRRGSGGRVLIAKEGASTADDGGGCMPMLVLS
jgi:hypothetical protein